MRRRPTDGHRFLLFHVNFGVPEEYAEGHLPGALFLDTNWLEDPADWNRRSPADIDATLRALGITHDTTVVLYGRDTEGDANEKWPGRRAGQIAATRAALILRYAGVTTSGCWTAATTGGSGPAIRSRRVARDPSPVPDLRRLHPAAARVHRRHRRGQADPRRRPAALVSVRSWREHIGKVSGYNYIGPAGRIAGDVWGNCGTDAYHMQHYRNVDNTMRAYPEIAANWARPASRPTSGSRSTAARAGGPRDLVLRLPAWAGSGSPCTTAAGSNGARTRSTTRSRSGEPEDEVAA